MSVVETNLGGPFRRLWFGATASALGDGMWLAALPLLAASLSRDPLLVSLLELAAGLPWLLFGLSSGVIADRLDRRALMWWSDLARLLLVGALAVVVATSALTVWLLLVVVFLLASVGTAFSSAAPALLPSLVADDRLHHANARLASGVTSGRSFVGPASGAALFGLVGWIPFAVNAVSFAVSAWCVRGLPAEVGRERAPRRAMRHDINEGLAWIWRDRPLRVMLASGALLAMATSAFLAIFVLFTLEDLGLPQYWYGILITLYAVGSLAGSVVVTPVVDRLGLRRSTQLAAVLGAVAFMAIGVTTLWPVVAVALVLFGIAASAWNITAVTIRQSRTPRHLLGRVSSTFATFTVGSAPLGAPVGGLLAKAFGLQAAILFAASAAAVAAILLLVHPPVVHTAG